MNLSDLAADDNPALRRALTARIEAEGSISFADFMRTVLYDPQHGYYRVCDPTLDYESSSNVHPVFGAALGRQLADFWRLLDRPSRFDAFEAGAGSCRLAADILRYVERAEPDFYNALHYVVQDVSLVGPNAAAVVERAGLPPDKVEVAAELPSSPEIEGCILSNELLDALPFLRVRRRDGQLLEVRVGLEGNGFVDVEAPAPAAVEAYFEALGLAPGEGCDAEVNLEAPRWLERAAGALRHGYLLTLDYGYEAPALYAPWRRAGTLLTFYRHTSSNDPYARLGRQDITASVDLTTAQRTGEAAGLRTHGLVAQTEFLTALGISEALAQQPAAGEIEAYYALRRAVMTLTDAAGLGRIRVLIQGRDTPDTPPRGLSGDII